MSGLADRRAGAPEPDLLARLTLGERDAIVCAVVSGELDFSNVARVQAELHALPNRALGLVVDLRATTFIDSTAVAMLFGLRERLRRRGQLLRVVVAAGSAPRRVLELTGYERAGPLDREVAGADEAIRAAAAGGV